MQTKRRHIGTSTLAAILALTIAIIGYGADSAHGAQRHESPQLAAIRDTHAVQRCDRFQYDGHSPTRKVCRALLRATKTVTVKGRPRATRRWVWHTATLKLLRHESGYSLHAVNPTSGACGLGQMLPCDKYGPGTCWTSAREQAECFVRYVLSRYWHPRHAWAFWLCPDPPRCTQHWY